MLGMTGPPSCPHQGPEHNRYSVIICWINKWLNIPIHHKLPSNMSLSSNETGSAKARNASFLMKGSSPHTSGRGNQQQPWVIQFPIGIIFGKRNKDGESERDWKEKGIMGVRLLPSHLSRGLIWCGGLRASTQDTLKGTKMSFLPSFPFLVFKCATAPPSNPRNINSLKAHLPAPLISTALIFATK